MRSPLPSAPSGVLTKLGLLSICASLTATATPLNDLQQAAAEWSRIRSETSRIEADWRSEREVLEASISGLEVRAEQLELEQQALAAESTKNRDVIARLTARNQADAARIDETVQRVEQLSQKLVELRPALPPRLSSALEVPYRTITESELQPADRMRHTMAILNRCQQFDRTFVMSEEILEMSAGAEPRLVEVVYWGLSQACALDRSANEAFIGRPVNGRWTWEAAPGFEAAAAKLLAVRADEAPPEFITLPFKMTGGAK
ncbi:MAG: hypothetical protein SynsKO_00120 [Synoicihabitans sp.]